MYKLYIKWYNDILHEEIYSHKDYQLIKEIQSNRVKELENIATTPIVTFIHII